MSNKLNIFNSLPQFASDDEDDNTQNRTKKVTGTKATDKQAPKGKGPAPQKEEHTRAKETRKDKAVTSQPHPLDRHSGTGNQAYGAKPKKGGAGKGNWGKTTEEGGAAATEEKVGEEETTETQQPAEEEKPSLTLQEYYQQHRFAEDDQEVNEAKAKITSDQLLKELGKATALKSKNQEANDDKKVGKKKGRLDINHHAGISTEHADLLGFRTGFIEKEYRQRKEGEELPPRRTGGQGERRERREREDAKQEETPAQPTEAGVPAEGEQTSPTQQAGEGQERRRDGGYRGGQRGGQRGGHRGGPREGGNQGPRKPYVPRGGDQAKINITDESAFPKLG